MAETFRVHLKRDNTSVPWGFRIVGGVDFSTPLSVQLVNPGSVAEIGGIRAGDNVLQINDRTSDTLEHEAAKYEILRAGLDINFIIQRGQTIAWRPKVTPLEDLRPSEIKSVNVGGHDIQLMQSTSLASNLAPLKGVGGSYNRSPKPFPGSFTSQPEPPQQPPPQPQQGYQPPQSYQPVPSYQPPKPFQPSHASQPQQHYDEPEHDRYAYSAVSDDPVSVGGSTPPCDDRSHLPPPAPIPPPPPLPAHMQAPPASSRRQASPKPSVQQELLYKTRLSGRRQPSPEPEQYAAPPQQQIVYRNPTRRPGESVREHGQMAPVEQGYAPPRQQEMIFRNPTRRPGEGPPRQREPVRFSPEMEEYAPPPQQEMLFKNPTRRPGEGPPRQRQPVSLSPEGEDYAPPPQQEMIFKNPTRRPGEGPPRQRQPVSISPEMEEYAPPPQQEILFKNPTRRPGEGPPRQRQPVQLSPEMEDYAPPPQQEMLYKNPTRRPGQGAREQAHMPQQGYANFTPVQQEEIMYRNPTRHPQQQEVVYRNPSQRPQQQAVQKPWEPVGAQQYSSQQPHGIYNNSVSQYSPTQEDDDYEPSTPSDNKPKRSPQQQQMMAELQQQFNQRKPSRPPQQSQAQHQPAPVSQPQYAPPHQQQQMMYATRQPEQSAYSSAPRESYQSPHVNYQNPPEEDLVPQYAQTHQTARSVPFHPGGPVGGAAKSLVHAQYNSPMGMYSDMNVAETYVAQAEALVPGISKMALGGGGGAPGGFRSVRAPMGKAPGEIGPPPTANRCSACGSLIVGMFVKIRGEPMHPECFKCATCGKNLKNQGYFFVEGRMYCEPHARSASKPPSDDMYAVPVYR